MRFLKGGWRVIQAIWNLIQVGLSASQVVPLVVTVVATVAIIWGVIWTWARGWDPVQKALFSLATFLLLYVVIYLIVRWWQRHNIESIADKIDELDNLTVNYIDNCMCQLKPEEWKAMLNDYGVLLGISFHRYAKAWEDNDKAVMEQEYDRISKAYGSKLSPKDKFGTSIGDLRDFGGLLDKYGIGLKALKGSKRHQRLSKAITNLQRQLPAVSISSRVNQYFYESDGYYNLMLSIKPLTGPSTGKESRIPTKVEVRIGQMRPIVEGRVSDLIASVRESVVAYRERNRDSARGK